MAYIKKEPIVEFITKGLNNPDKTKAYGYDAIEILAEIEYAPTADVVEVVRCKDCFKGFKKNDKSKLNIYFCDKWKNIMRDCDYCSYGERRRCSNDNNTI